MYVSLVLKQLNQLNCIKYKLHVNLLPLPFTHQLNIACLSMYENMYASRVLKQLNHLNCIKYKLHVNLLLSLFTYQLNIACVSIYEDPRS